MRQYFEFAGWAVAPTGVEDIVAHLPILPNVAAGHLSSLPDFLISKTAGSVRNPRTQKLGQSFYVEVKTHAKWDNRFDATKYHRWGDVLLVWVGPSGLMGTWIHRPGTDDAPKDRIEQADFKELANVGVVSIAHCDDVQCQGGVRAYFDAMATMLARQQTKGQDDGFPSLQVPSTVRSFGLS